MQGFKIFELAYRMQMDATDAFDLEKEPKYLRDLYGGTCMEDKL